MAKEYPSRTLPKKAVLDIAGRHGIILRASEKRTENIAGEIFFVAKEYHSRTLSKKAILDITDRYGIILCASEA